MPLLRSTRVFPCPVCAEPRDVRTTKKNKPYVVCDSCGVQVFVRGSLGIGTFAKLVERASHEDVIGRFSEMERRYRLRCPECRNHFWIAKRLIKTSVFDGGVKGCECPHKGCGAIVPWRDAS